MAISNLWEMAKADRYTADGREAIAKAREADVEDRTYQIGEISQKTGLQKTAEGWVTPKEKANAAIEAKGKSENKSDKWEKNKDYLNRERISMKTPSGGSVSIYESENPNQKNNRFRVDTGDYYNDFNTLEEAKAFAEKEYGGNSAGGAKKEKTETSLNKKKNSLENAKKMAESYRKTSNKPIYITEKDGDYVVAKGRDELEYAKENGYRLVPEGENTPRQLTGDCKITIKG